VERPRWLENLFQSYDIAEYRHSDIVAHAYGDVAVTSKYYWRGKRGRGEKEAFVEHGYVVDVWRHSNGRWQVASRISIIEPGKEQTAPKEKWAIQCKQAAPNGGPGFWLTCSFLRKF
jgi:hypothetical protein